MELIGAANMAKTKFVPTRNSCKYNARSLLLQYSSTDPNDCNSNELWTGLLRKTVGSYWYLFQLASFIVVTEALKRLLLQIRIWYERNLYTDDLRSATSWSWSWNITRFARKHWECKNALSDLETTLKMVHLVTQPCSELLTWTQWKCSILFIQQSKKITLKCNFPVGSIFAHIFHARYGTYYVS